MEELGGLELQRAIGLDLERSDEMELARWQRDRSSGARLPGDSIGDWEIISPVKMINNSMRGLELECAALSLGSLGGR